MEGIVFHSFLLERDLRDTQLHAWIDGLTGIKYGLITNFLSLTSSSIRIQSLKTMATYAAAPFDHAKADVILRSSDNIDFRVFKLFLSLASPFFETLFDIPQPTEGSEEQEIKDGLAVIPVTEDSKTLDSLLRFCYPCTLADDPKLEVLTDLIAVLDAAKKYSLDAIETKARQAISNPTILEAEPLRCFAIAHRGRLPEETRLAAKYTLTQPLIPSWFEEIDLITATDLLALLTYHKACGDAVYALRTDVSWIKTHYGSNEACGWLAGRHYHTESEYNDYYGTHNQVLKEGNCGCPRSSRSQFKVFNEPLQWWDDFMEEVFTSLRDKPCRATIQSLAEKTVETVKALKCQGCSPKVSEGMRDFTDLFARKIEEEVSQIQLPLKF